MSFQTRNQAMVHALQYQDTRGRYGRSDITSVEDLVEAAKAINHFLVHEGDPWDQVGQNSTTIADRLDAMHSDIERILDMTVDLSQAEADFSAALQVDAEQKQALKQQISDLQAALAAAQAADANDVAARDAALQQAQDAANALEAGAQALNPITPPTGGGGDTTTPTDGGGDTAPTDGGDGTTPSA
jgi:multidrug efflux pump subunit AcrA (membrane-fusion protein)